MSTETFWIKKGRMSLWFAAIEGKVEIAKLLLEEGMSL